LVLTRSSLLRRRRSGSARRSRSALARWIASRVRTARKETVPPRGRPLPMTSRGAPTRHAFGRASRARPSLPARRAGSRRRRGERLFASRRASTEKRRPSRRLAVDDVPGPHRRRSAARGAPRCFRRRSSPHRSARSASRSAWLGLAIRTYEAGPCGRRIESTPAATSRPRACSAGLWTFPTVGRRSSATTRPRSVTSTVSPAATSRR
jgi:hypothetical protein